MPPLPPTAARTPPDLVERARRSRRRGETRKMIVALRQACMLDERAAWLWALYGAMLARSGRPGEAREALRHAVWVRRSDGDSARARSTQRLLDAIPT